MQFLYTATVLALLSISSHSTALAAPANHVSDGTITNVANPDYVTAYPICGARGFTQIPGNYTQTEHQQPNATLKGCLEDCRKAPGCLSVSYAAKYTGCWFFDRYTQDVQLIEDQGSYFDHYDHVCFPFDTCPTTY